jgi:hypothetical protein
MNYRILPCLALNERQALASEGRPRYSWTSIGSRTTIFTV